ncbi:chaperonin 10-like protein [Xylariales sp. PMI_506]|nr:chaperonin 10-like protein [Xylariales sp. PMI_506]
MAVTQKAIVVTADHQESLVQDRPLPTLRDDSVLVKTVSVGLNPTDWKHIQFFAPIGSLIGCDYAGIVEEVGKDVKKPFKKGDRIWGFSHGGNAVQHEDGAFAEYIVVNGDLQDHIPENLSFQEAATLGIGIYTVAQGLYQSLGMALPTQPIEQPQQVLIYGASTATGALAVQFAKLSGYEVIATCSPRNFDYVKSLGAATVFDYNEVGVAAKIRKHTGNGLKLAFDCISLEPSAKFCDEALSTEGGDYSALLPIGIERANVKDRNTLVYTIFGKSFQLGPIPFPESREDREYAERFMPIARQLLADGRLKVHKVAVKPGGLRGVLEGLQLLREDKVSGEKLVYNIDETK